MVHYTGLYFNLMDEIQISFDSDRIPHGSDRFINKGFREQLKVVINDRDTTMIITDAYIYLEGIKYNYYEKNFNNEKIISAVEELSIFKNMLFYICPCIITRRFFVVTNNQMDEFVEESLL